MQETQESWFWFLGQEDSLELGMAIHSNILARKIPWTEEPGGLWFTELQSVRHDWSSWAHMHTLGPLNLRGSVSDGKIPSTRGGAVLLSHQQRTAPVSPEGFQVGPNRKFSALHF